MPVVTNPLDTQFLLSRQTQGRQEKTHHITNRWTVDIGAIKTKVEPRAPARFTYKFKNPTTLFRRLLQKRKPKANFSARMLPRFRMKGVERSFLLFVAHPLAIVFYNHINALWRFTEPHLDFGGSSLTRVLDYVQNVICNCIMH